MSPPTAPPTTEGSSRAFWIALAIGVPILLFGVRGAMAHAGEAHPPELFRWIAASAVVHDALVFPVVAGIGTLGKRWSPGWAWPALRWALAVSALLLVVSRPFVARWGYNPANPTALDRDYGLGVAIAIAGVWLLAALWAITARRTGHHPRPSLALRSGSRTDDEGG